MAKILIVDDEHLNRQLLVRLLCANQHRVLEASDGEEAREIIGAKWNAVGLLNEDAQTQMSGRELVENVRRVSPGIKVLFISGYMDDAIVRHGLLDQEINYLQKPFTPEALMRKVRETLDTPNEIHEIRQPDVQLTKVG